jgi:putative phage-type endonuclease
MSLKFHYHKDLPKPTPAREEYLQNQVFRLRNIFQPEQKSKEWYELRDTMLTASDWGTILGENHYVNSNDGVLLKKCGDADNFVYNDAMKWGNKYEQVAVIVYEHRNNVKILEFGCLRHPFFYFLGASPDGITTDGVMLEIKCPSSREITGDPPPHYWCQVQGQLEVCELDRCDFLECRFKEYNNEQEYLEDYFENEEYGQIKKNYFLNRFGHEKGIVVEFYKKADKTFYYDYSPVYSVDNDLEEWKLNIIQKHENDNVMFSTFYYWYLEKVSCVPIYRNQEWFHVKRIDLEDFWNKVLHYRKVGLDKLKEDLQNKKNQKKLEKEIKKNEKEREKGEKKPSKKAKTTDNAIYLDMNDFVTGSKINKPVLKKEEDSGEQEEIKINFSNKNLFKEPVPSIFNDVNDLYSKEEDDDDTDVKIKLNFSNRRLFK